MSKVDAQRAMREARYAQNAARATAARATRDPQSTSPTTAPTPTAATTTPAVKKAAQPTKAAAAPSTGELCGHKSMNGRSCTREANHPEKSHRYS